MFKKIALRNCLMLILGSTILSFGLYNVHLFADVTEGGVLGATLLLHHWFNVSPAISGFILNLACYIMGYQTLGKQFIVYSIISSTASSVSYFIFEMFPPFWPNIMDYPLVAAILGALFVGVGVGIAVRAGGAPGGDDALALSVSQLTNIKIQWIYLFNDLVILLLSLSYIPLDKIIYSLITVFLSGQIIGFISNFKADVSRETL